MNKATLMETFRYCLLALGVLFLAKASQGLIAYVVYFYDEQWFGYIFYVSVGSFAQVLFSPVMSFNEWANELFKSICVYTFFGDVYNLTKLFWTAPILEEIEFRLPLFLLRKHSDKCWWKILAVVSCLMFALVHNRGVVSLLTIFVVGAVNLWLIIRYNRFWPAILVHCSFNLNVTFTAFFSGLIRM